MLKNIYLKELGNYKKSGLFWILAIVGLLVSGMSKYQGYSGSGTSINELMKSLPAGFSAIFGIGTIDLESIGGFFAILALYLTIMLGVQAVLLGSGIISKEETDKTAEFLFAKPVSRARVLTSKVFAAVTIVVFLNITTTVSSVLVVDAFNKGSSINNEVLFLMPGIFFTQLLFLTIGISFASILKQPKRAGMFGAFVLLTAFILSVFIDLTDKFNFLEYLTPFKYFDSKVIFINNSYDVSFIFITFAIVASLISASYIFYRKRDFYL